MVDGEDGGSRKALREAARSRARGAWAVQVDTRLVGEEVFVRHVAREGVEPLFRGFSDPAGTD